MRTASRSSAAAAVRVPGSRSPFSEGEAGPDHHGDVLTFCSEGGGQASGCEPPVPRWSTSRMSCPLVHPAPQIEVHRPPLCSLAAPPGPPARYVNASDLAGRRREGTTTTRSPIPRADAPVSRFWGTRSVPHFAGHALHRACAPEAAWPGRPAPPRAGSTSAVASIASRPTPRIRPRRSLPALPAPPPAARRGPERRAGDVVEPGRVAELDRLRVAAVLAADPDPQTGLAARPRTTPSSTSSPTPSLVERLERVVSSTPSSR